MTTSGRSAVQAIAFLLQENWTETVSGRTNDVPEPEILTANEDSQKSLRTEGKIVVDRGGQADLEQLGFGATHEGADTPAVIEIRAYDRRLAGTFESGRDYLYGVRPNATTAPDRHSGLTGEVLRILKANRKGFGEFDRLQYGPEEDQSDVEGQGTYRADITALPIIHAGEIDPST